MQFGLKQFMHLLWLIGPIFVDMVFRNRSNEVFIIISVQTAVLDE